MTMLVRCDFQHRTFGGSMLFNFEVLKHSKDVLQSSREDVIQFASDRAGVVQW